MTGGRFNVGKGYSEGFYQEDLPMVKKWARPSKPKRYIPKWKREENAHKHRWQKYKLTKEQYEELRSKQHDRCAICGISEEDARLGVDHDHYHETGKVRGLLCDKCNSGLGNFRDSISLLEKAIRYLHEAGD